MPWLKRRSYLSSIITTVSGLAGLGTDDAPEESTPNGGASTEMEQTAAMGDQTREPVPPHDHSGNGFGGSHLAPQEIQAGIVRGHTIVAGEIQGEEINGHEIVADQLRAAETAGGRRIADPGHLQSVLAASDPGDVVQLRPERYQPGEELTVPRGVTLDFNGGYIEVASDHPVLFPDNGTRLICPEIIVPQDVPFSSPVIHCDTTRTTGSENQGTYDPRYGQEIRIDDLTIMAESFPDADQSGSIGIHLDARGSYIQFNRITADIIGLDYQVVGTATSEEVVNGTGLRGYINGNVVSGHFRNAQTTAIRHQGDWAMRSTIEGIIQPGNATEYGIVNATADKNRSVFLRGIIWDTGDTTAATKGARINMRLDNDILIPPSEISDTPTEETTMYTGQTPGYGHVVRNGDGNMIAMRPDDVKSIMYTDGNESMHMRASGGMTPPPQDLSTQEPPQLDRGVIYRHNGNGTITTRSNGETSAAGLYVWDDVEQVFEQLATLASS